MSDLCDDVVRLEQELDYTKIKLKRLRSCLLMIRDANPPAGTVFPAEWFEGYARQAATQVLED